ncbi:7-cyano-7-deazaguanine synthase QueC [candidate division KSB1 bacterium]|nr:7-cyano-7-deazaguanine synthase QueC [candidate division KSB1 bacterium]
MADKKAIVLLSGGLDSATCCAYARSMGFKIYALSFLYGQKGFYEISAAQKIAAQTGAVEHRILEIGLGEFGGSSLTTEAPVPTSEPVAEGIPSTYVPARNTIFLSYALAYAEVTGAFDIFIGTNSLDYSGYPDCRPEYLEAFEKMANLATRSGIEGHHLTIHSPLQNLNKAEIVRKGTELGVDFSLTCSCYQPTPDGKACGECESCRLRLRGFAGAGLTDPIEYIKK